MNNTLHKKRRQKRARRQSGSHKLSLISLMDIFTILVFFLMVNSGEEVKVLQGDKSIKLPESAAQQLPANNLVVFVGKEDLLVQGKKISSVKEIVNTEDTIIPALKKELNYQASKKTPLDAQTAEKGYGVTIMGDETTEFSVLNKVLTTCSDTEFRDVSLAVNRKFAEKEQTDQASTAKDLGSTTSTTTALLSGL